MKIVMFVSVETYRKIMKERILDPTDYLDNQCKKNSKACYGELKKSIDFYAIRDVFDQDSKYKQHWDEQYKNGNQEGFYRYLESTSQRNE